MTLEDYIYGPVSLPYPGVTRPPATWHDHEALSYRISDDMAGRAYDNIMSLYRQMDRGRGVPRLSRGYVAIRLLNSVPRDISRDAALAVNVGLLQAIVRAMLVSHTAN